MMSNGMAIANTKCIKKDLHRIEPHSTASALCCILYYIILYLSAATGQRNIVLNEYRVAALGDDDSKMQCSAIQSSA